MNASSFCHHLCTGGKFDFEVQQILRHETWKKVSARKVNVFKMLIINHGISLLFKSYGFTIGQ